tara:strand:+ start:694 stop:882 length:189 start_codon:yes stop_codon:yes gene_type:complete
MSIKAEVQIHYISPLDLSGDKKFLSIRLKNLDISHIEKLIKERLLQMYPKESSVKYEIIGIS